MKKKLLAAILAGILGICMFLASFPPIAVAGVEITFISDRAGLEEIKNHLSGSFRLTADIDLEGESWVPLPAFSGKLDGAGYTIRNLTIADTAEDTGDYKGLFTAIDTRGEVVNLAIEDANIVADDYVGIISGTNAGTISCCYTTGTLSGDEFVGGIVGSNGSRGSIENCYSRAFVCGKNYFGALTGSNLGAVSKCYAASTVTDPVMSSYLVFNATPLDSGICYNAGGMIDIPHNDAYAGTAFTIEAWFEWKDIGKTGLEGINFIVGKGDPQHIEQFEIHTSGTGLRFIPVPDGPVSGSPGSYDGDSYIDVRDVLHPGWVHVAAVYSYNQSTQTASVQVYIDGEAQDLWKKLTEDGEIENVGKTATISRSFNPLEFNTYPINIARRTDNSFYFDGRIADVRFWDTARSAADIKANKDRLLDGDEGGLVGYWKLDEASGLAIDSSSTQNDGTLIGDVSRFPLGTPSANKGALTGSGTLTDCYYDYTVFGSELGGSGTAKTTSLMKTKSTYTGWDFDTIWKIEAGSYPTLRFMIVNSVMLNPFTVSVEKGGTQEFNSMVLGVNNPVQTVTWSVEDNDSATTTISTSGVLRVGADETAETIFVIATSTLDPTKSAVSTVTVITPYQIIQGAGGQWINGSANGLSFTSNGDYDGFTSVSVDGSVISSDEYTSQSGSTIVTLNSDYLTSLTAGRHTLRINYIDGRFAQTDFTVSSGTPFTGDNSNVILWVAVAALAVVGLAVCIVLRRKGKKENREV